MRGFSLKVEIYNALADVQVLTFKDRLERILMTVYVVHNYLASLGLFPSSGM
jgi:hypothetical protein